MNVLLVEDDLALARVMGLELHHAGFVVTAVHDGRSALDGLASTAGARPDVVLLDVILPDLSGIEVFRRIRDRLDVPVIMVTARGQVPDIVSALDMGADDYVVKPVNYEELGARIRAAVRRRTGRIGQGRVIDCGDLALYRDQHRLECNGASMDLSPLEYRLLEQLLLHRNWVQSRESLDAVWGAEYFGNTNMVEVTVSRLRRRLQDGGSTVQIDTVRGSGYVIRAPSP